jgi:N-acetylglucosamine kinase-like BadF-type ATPase
LAQYFLGVDGGQSGTTAVIGDEHGKILGWATAGPCNHVAASEAQAKFVRVMKECVGPAAHRAGIETNSFTAACLGMSGGPDDKAGLLKQVFTADHTFVTHDAMIALAGATAGEPGVVVVSGTGSIAFGENSRRETARAGGWGYIFGDEGGAFDLVRQSLRAILREHEGWGPRTALTPALLEATGSQDANQLLHLFYKPDWPRARIATLAKSVNRIAEEGDPVALNLVQQAAHHLALLIGAVRSQLFAEGEEAIVSWTGGVFSSEILLRRFRELVSMNDGVRCEAPKHGPATGALLLAYRAMGLPVLPDRPD